jgi:hypothetical protein
MASFGGFGTGFGASSGGFGAQTGGFGGFGAAQPAATTFGAPAQPAAGGFGAPAAGGFGAPGQELKTLPHSLHRHPNVTKFTAIMDSSGRTSLT